VTTASSRIIAAASPTMVELESFIEFVELIWNDSAVDHINQLNICRDNTTEMICPLKFNSHIQRQVGSRRRRQEDPEVSCDTDLPAITTSASVTDT